MTTTEQIKIENKRMEAEHEVNRESIINEILNSEPCFVVRTDIFDDLKNQIGFIRAGRIQRGLTERRTKLAFLDMNTTDLMITKAYCEKYR